MQDPEERLRRQKKEEDLDEEPDYKPIDWRKFVRSWRFFALCLIAVAVIVLVILIAVDKNAIVSKLTPIAQKIRAIRAGWLIPIAILFVISFPPLFGHEIIALLCGVVYGLGIGFGIVAAGTFFGELGTWFAFKYILRKRARALELTNLYYGALARLIRQGGFWIVVAVRLSVVPSHMSTAVLSTCNVKFWHFVVAVFLSLPKQLVIVYIGTLIAGGQSETTAKALVFIVGFGITAAVSIYIMREMRKNTKILLEEQDRRRENRERERLELEDLPRNSSSSQHV